MTESIAQGTTAEDLWEVGDDGHRYDLIRGELIQVSLASPREGRLSPRIGMWLGN